MQLRRIQMTSAVRRILTFIDTVPSKAPPVVVHRDADPVPPYHCRRVLALAEHAA
ncbi:MAG TPA: hypothetical protein VMX33_04350 [bacterium]|nr:hypothetical protein [bacterium]